MRGSSSVIVGHHQCVVVRCDSHLVSTLVTQDALNVRVALTQCDRIACFEVKERQGAISSVRPVSIIQLQSVAAALEAAGLSNNDCHFLIEPRHVCEISVTDQDLPPLPHNTYPLFAPPALRATAEVYAYDSMTAWLATDLISILLHRKVSLVVIY